MSARRPIGWSIGRSVSLWPFLISSFSGILRRYQILCINVFILLEPNILGWCEDLKQFSLYVRVTAAPFVDEINDFMKDFWMLCQMTPTDFFCLKRYSWTKGDESNTKNIHFYFTFEISLYCHYWMKMDQIHELLKDFSMLFSMRLAKNIFS